MATTFESLLASLARDLGELSRGVRIASATLSGAGSSVGTTTTLIDINNRFEPDANILKNALFRVVADSGQPTNVRQLASITTYDPSTKTLTLSPALAAATSTTTQYQIFRYLAPSQYMEALNDALNDSFPWIYDWQRDETTLDFVPNQFYYTVPSTIRRLRRVLVQIDMGNPYAPYAEIPFRTEQGAESRRFYIPDNFSIPAGAAIRCEGMGAVTSLAAETDSLNLDGEHLIPIVLYAKSKLAEQIAARARGAGDTQGRYKSDAEKYYGLWRQALKDHRMTPPGMSRLGSRIGIDY